MGAVSVPAREHPCLSATFKKASSMARPAPRAGSAAPPLVEHRHRCRYPLELPLGWWAAHAPPERDRHPSGRRDWSQLPPVPAGHDRNARRRGAASRGPRRYWCRCQDHRCTDYRPTRQDRRQFRGAGGCSGGCDSCRDSCTNSQRRITYRSVAHMSAGRRQGLNTFEHRAGGVPHGDAGHARDWQLLHGTR